jgi:ribosome biogenesis GTPase A
MLLNNSASAILMFTQCHCLISETIIAKNSTKVLNREELIQLFESFRSEGKVTIGLVGYPNVGKSSTINALLASKKVSVSQTPGKTKHFQVNLSRRENGLVASSPFDVCYPSDLD